MQDWICWGHRMEAAQIPSAKPFSLPVAMDTEVRGHITEANVGVVH